MTHTCTEQQENVREGTPYNDPAFESLARELGVWGTAQSATCAQFWQEAQAQRAPLKEDAIRILYGESDGHWQMVAPQVIQFARSIERAHGITQEQG